MNLETMEPTIVSLSSSACNEYCGEPYEKLPPHRATTRPNWLYYTWVATLSFLSWSSISRASLHIPELHYDEPPPDTLLDLPETPARPTRSQRVGRNIATLLEGNPSPNAGANRHDHQRRLFEAQKGQITLFYNVFVPNDLGQTAKGRAKSIVKDQLNLIGKSAAVKISRESGSETVLYYNTIGNASFVEETIDNECSRFGIRCVHMKHYGQGDEHHTLTRMQEFCQINPRARVSYLHNKGSFHYSYQNTIWRRSLTVAVLNRSCLQPPDRSCNVCGLTFQPIWTQFMPGNMFSADCNYVNKLLTPLAYSQRMKELADIAQHKYNFSSHMYPNQGNDFWGVGRFSNEHWIGSHPDLRPCDMSRVSKFEYWLKQTHREASGNFSWALAPRHTLESQGWAGVLDEKTIGQTMRRTRMRRREYTFLAGSLHRWIGLYNQTPPADSWVYDFYPDANYWRRGIHKHGNNVVEALLSENNR